MAGKQSGASKRTANQGRIGNPLEAFKDIASDFGRGINEDLLKGTASDLLSEVGLKPHKRTSGTLSPEETLDLKTIIGQQEEEIVTPKAPIRTERAFHSSQENFLFLRKEQNLEHEIEALLVEIKKEVKRFETATQTLEAETAKVVVEEIPPNPGIYHVNFFEWLLGLLKNIRQKVENAGTWLNILQSKKAKKGYWAKFKKHGTSFGLSGERVVATQTG